ncbi:MAG TPA: AbrB/MazE/SpoVT family DNA-binding domain-containing protein [Acidimicrobiales bacterium]|nr:AbrB/MazE/SpoVT family DNA-binding domain-containing protein [Acidimicrobiales bacterium]
MAGHVIGSAGGASSVREAPVGWRRQMESRWKNDGIFDGMRTTIDRAGRLVIPKRLRDQVGLSAGEVEVTVDGAGLRVEPVAGDELVEENGYLVIPATGITITDEMVRALRFADQR